jgi:hypothetical protein
MQKMKYIPMYAILFLIVSTVFPLKVSNNLAKTCHLQLLVINQY